MSLLILCIMLLEARKRDYLRKELSLSFKTSLLRGRDMIKAFESCPIANHSYVNLAEILLPFPLLHLGLYLLRFDLPMMI
jgi:hypothetical protein